MNSRIIYRHLTHRSVCFVITLSGEENAFYCVQLYRLMDCRHEG